MARPASLRVWQLVRSLCPFFRIGSPRAVCRVLPELEEDDGRDDDEKNIPRVVLCRLKQVDDVPAAQRREHERDEVARLGNDKDGGALDRPVGPARRGRHPPLKGRGAQGPGHAEEGKGDHVQCAKVTEGQRLDGVKRYGTAEGEWTASNATVTAPHGWKPRAGPDRR